MHLERTRFSCEPIAKASASIERMGAHHVEFLDVRHDKNLASGREP